MDVLYTKLYDLCSAKHIIMITHATITIDKTPITKEGIVRNHEL